MPSVGRQPLPHCAGASPDTALGGPHLPGRPLEGGGGQVQACPSWAYPPSPFPADPPMSRKGQPGGPAVAQQARKDSWARLQRDSLLGEAVVGLGGLTWVFPAAPPPCSHSKGPRGTHHTWLDPSQGPGGAEPACAALRQVPGGGTGKQWGDQAGSDCPEFQGAMGSAVLCTRGAGRAMSVCAGVHTVWVHWVCVSERLTGARRSRPGRAPPLMPG